MEWQPIDTAPKDCAILLWVDAVDGSAATAWQGSWSWMDKEWVIHLPFEVDFKRAVITASPKPTHWMPRLPPPENKD